MTDDVLTAVLRHSGLTKEELFTPSRHKPMAIWRQFYVYLMRTERVLSTAAIKAKIGRTNHTTVLHSSQAVRHYAFSDPELSERFSAVLSDLGAPPIIYPGVPATDAQVVAQYKRVSGVPRRDHRQRMHAVADYANRHQRDVEALLFPVAAWEDELSERVGYRVHLRARGSEF